MRAMAASLSASVIFSFLTSRSRLPETVAMPLATEASAISTMTTLIPDTAHACAMPLPMVPAPIMPTVVMLMGGTFCCKKWMNLRRKGRLHSPLRQNQCKALRLQDLVGTTPDAQGLGFLDQLLPEVRMRDVDQGLRSLPGRLGLHLGTAKFGHDVVHDRTRAGDYRSGRQRRHNARANRSVFLLEGRVDADKTLATF